MVHETGNDSRKNTRQDVELEYLYSYGMKSWEIVCVFQFLKLK